MPRFLHSSDPDLSDLNRAKRNVNADYKKQYSAQDGNHDNLGQLADVDSIYNTLSTRLLGLQTSLQDIFQGLEVATTGYHQILSPSYIANFQQLASRVLTEVNAVQLLMGRIKNFNMFTPPQSQGLADLVSQIEALNDFIEGTLQTLQGYERGQYVIDAVSTYENQLKLLLQFLDGASRNYQAVEANPKSVEARYGRGRMRGGVAFQYRPTTMTGGALVPAYNGLGVFGSDGYRIGDYFSYTDPRRFY